MKTVALIDDNPVSALDGFTKAPTPSRTTKAPKRAAKKPIPFKVQWLNQIARDGTLPALAVRAAIVLADYYDDEKGYAWPSQLRLAAELNASRGGVKGAIKRLGNAGYVEYVPERGRKRTNRYFLRCPEQENGY